MIVLLGGTGWFLTHLPAVQFYFADERTIAGEMRDIPLADGSRVVLASASGADLDMVDGGGVVRLLRGEMLAEVVRGQVTHFRVETVDGTAEVLGTAFTVRKEDRATVVAVISSKVRTCPVSADPAGCVTLSPGERARLADGAVERLADVDPNDVAAWTEGWLPAQETPLVDVLDELNRWRENPVHFDRQQLSGLLVSGIFSLQDTDGALTNLARSQPIVVDRKSPGSLIVTRKRE